MIPCVKSGEQGITLAEVLVASALAFLVMVGIGRFDVSRFLIAETIRQRSAQVGLGEQEAALAAIHLSRRLTTADRISLLNSGIPGMQPHDGGAGGLANVQLRIPVCPAAPATPACYDAAASYRWDQYVRNGTELRYYEDVVNAGCGNRRVLASQIGSFTLAFQEIAPAPPGGESFIAPLAPADNNILEYTVLWDNGAVPTPLTHEFRGQAVSRSIAYTDLNADCVGPSGPCDSGRGLDPTGTFGPPGLCP